MENIKPYLTTPVNQHITNSHHAHLGNHIFRFFSQWQFQRKQKFAKVTPEDSYPPPQCVDEPNVVYRSRMKMSDQVLDSIFSKGSEYRRNEYGDERLPYLVSRNEPRS
ncbi:hypothetical protein DPMN_173499 [Dreissena polymorpha]|uniref:Uncharacterized protein n=1 Tax=Dreissena polymorpha TaxID=45954 RepID=A0A9D4IGZ9_DREPO|nr:hypothetical protein DPMN_173499 [Dreissena polymorpha]